MRRRSLTRLAEQYGVQTSYTDERGRPCRVAPQHVAPILELLGVASNGGQHERSPVQVRILPACLVVTEGQEPGTLTVRLPIPASLARRVSAVWTIRGEAAIRQLHDLTPLTVSRTKMVEGRPSTTITLPAPTHLGRGYYEVELELDAPDTRHHASMQMIVTPARCFLPPGWQGTGTSSRSTDRARLWGLTLQLYGLRTRRNWGIGDFRDLREIVKWTARLGAAMVGVNPLHALLPGAASPYSPSSRLFHNPLYLDVEGIPEFRESEPLQRIVAAAAFRRRLEAVRRAPTVDYDEVARMKERAFRLLYRTFVDRHLRADSRRARAFRRFVHEEGQALERFAVFQALQRHFMKRDVSAVSWRSWPAEYQDPSAPAVLRFIERNREEIDFHRYLQWQCQRQLQAVAETAARAEMAIGLYTDFAVGIDPGGADAWAYRPVLVGGVSVGAPPDLFSPKGQSWGLTPPHPVKLCESGYRFFIESYGRNMRHSGLLRLDHAMNLFRLFWVPEGRPATEGAYVAYPSQDLLGILALESRRAGVVVVGEDLGTVTPEIRAELMKHGLLSYRLLLFEKDAKGRFLPPDRYPAQAMTAVSTHDLPTLRGFWLGRDIEHKEALGLYPDPESVRRDREGRARDQGALVHALTRADLLPHDYKIDPTTFDDRLRHAVHRYLARTPCRLLAVSLEDLLDDLDTPNIPGADPARYPVWRRKAGPDGAFFEEWRTSRIARDLAATIRRERPGSAVARKPRHRATLSA